MKNIVKGLLAAAGLVALVSCGGGGSSEPDASVSFSKGTLTATAFQNQAANVNASQTASVTVDATISNNHLSGTVVVVVRDTASGFAGSPIQVVQSGPTTYRATLHPNAALAPGNYTGNLELHLCKDLGCTQEFSVSGGTLAYQVTILPQLQLTVLVNGAQAGTVKSGTVPLFLSMTDGSTVEVRSNVPMQMMFSSGPGFVTVTVDPASTSTVWRGVLARPAFPTTNQTSLTAAAQDASRTIQLGATLDVTMVP